MTLKLPPFTPRLLALALLPLALAGCQEMMVAMDDDQPPTPPPYPPGYEPAGRSVPDLVVQNLPEGIVEQQVLIADDGCYYFYQGALTTPITDAEGKTKLCVQREPVGIPVDMSGVTLGAPPRS